MERKDCETAETTYVAIELSKATWLIGLCFPIVTSPASTDFREEIARECWRDWRDCGLAPWIDGLFALRPAMMGSGLHAS